MLRLLYFKVIAQHCIVLICGMITKKKSIFRKICVAFNNAYSKIFGLPKRSSASTMYANHNIYNFDATLRKNTFWIHAEAGTEHQFHSTLHAYQ